VTSNIREREREREWEKERERMGERERERAEEEAKAALAVQNFISDFHLFLPSLGTWFQFRGHQGSQITSHACLALHVRRSAQRLSTAMTFLRR
jgi:hypothetical protein